MKLITQEIEKKLPALYEQEDKGNKTIAYVKLFTPDASFTWYITEYDAEQKLGFGLVDNGRDKELGYFSLEEIESVRGQFGLPVERDINFEETSLIDLGFGLKEEN